MLIITKSIKTSFLSYSGHSFFIKLAFRKIEYVPQNTYTDA